MHEQWIEMAEGEIRTVIDALADYCDIVAMRVREMDGYAKAVWEYQIGRIKQIQEKLEKSIGYNRDQQLETCRKRKSKKNDNIAEDALVLAARGRSGGMQ